jgi:hypothetical protein
MGWTIFAAVDLYIGVILIDLISKSAPPEKLPRLRKARNGHVNLGPWYSGRARMGMDLNHVATTP